MNNCGIFIKTRYPVIIPPQKLSAANFKDSKAYKFALSKMGNVIPVFRIKAFYNILVLHNHQSPQTVSTWAVRGNISTAEASFSS